jgi:murein DD-endopeptidase MepM/ murein hydrolase activator NlpD
MCFLRSKKQILIWCALALPALFALSLQAPALAPPREFLPDCPSAVFDGQAFAFTLHAREPMTQVTVTFRGRNVSAAAEKSFRAGYASQARFLLSIPLESPSKEELLNYTAQRPDKTTVKGSLIVAVKRKQYPVQQLTLAPKYVTPDPALKERIERERRLINSALGTFSAVRRWELPMKRPVPGGVSSAFGLRRVLNGQPRSPHKGVDFRAAAGDPVLAASDGTVVLTGEFYYTGNCVIVDHGLGVLTTYMHLSRIDARQGQLLKRGEVLGLVGSTGRSTGPHLHLGLTVLGQSADALPLLDKGPLPGPEAGAQPAEIQKGQTHDPE